MENYTYNSYPESGGSSPRSREIDFDNPPPWDDQSTGNNNYKVRLMCSYGGKIQPRPHDNKLAYIGGETKILAVDRSIKFSVLMAKLASVLCDADVSFKYQLPGEDLDALISVTNDEDIDHMMSEYDRLSRASPKPARLRLFLFPVNSFGSTDGRSERFVEALNSGPVQPSAQGNADFLFGSEKGTAPVAVAVPIPVPKAGDLTDPLPIRHVDPDIGADRIQKHIQDLRRLRIGEEQQQNMYRRQSDDNIAGYAQRTSVPTTLPGSVPGYQISGGFTASSADQQPVYMVPAAPYHTPLARPVTSHIGQGYYAVPRMPNEVYRDQQVYNAIQPIATQQQQQQQQQQQVQKIGIHSEGIRMVQATAGMTDPSYGQVAYDNTMGRHMYYAPPPSQGNLQQLPLQYQATLSQEGKVPTKITQGSI